MIFIVAAPPFFVCFFLQICGFPRGIFKLKNKLTIAIYGKRE